MNWIFTLLGFMAGITLFLFGMDTMGKYLEKMAGGTLENVLGKLTTNRFLAVIFGALVTAAIQSSTTTSVMVVGLVNSGIMKLSQAVGVLMGANIGTTITSWIMALASIGDEATLALQLLKPESLAGLAGFIGILLRMISKKEKRRDIGNILLGFAMLMLGMTTMKDAVAPLAELPSVQNLLVTFTNPLFGVLAGTILTVLVQSSATSVAILQSFCASGAVTFGAAIPIIMGQNIGTCFKALISAVGASKNAKRASFVHLYFNMIGTVLFLALFYIANAVFKFAFVDQAADTDKIALIHSMFNIGTTVVLFPFASLIEKLATITVREEAAKSDKDTKKDFKLLDTRFLTTPSFAIEQCKAVTLNMAQLSKKALFMAIDLLREYDPQKAQKVVELESEVDMFEDELGAYLVKVADTRLSEKDSNAVTKILRCIGDFERISDHALNIKEVADEISTKGLQFSEAAQREVAVLQKAVTDIVTETVNVFETEDMALAAKIEPLEEVVDELHREIKARHVERLVNGECTIQMGFVLSDLLTNYERVSDHCSNIAVAVIQMKSGNSDGAHSYLDTVKHDTAAFSKEVQLDESTYALPEKVTQ